MVRRSRREGVFGSLTFGTRSSSTANEIVLATHLCVRVMRTTTTPFQKIGSLPATKGRRSAERRIVLPIAAYAAARLPLCPPPLAGEGWEGAAPAFRRFTAALATGSYPDGSAPEPGFPCASSSQVFCPLTSRRRLSTLRADRSFCRSTGAPEPPECGLAIPPAGTAPRSASATCLSGEAPLVSKAHSM